MTTELLTSQARHSLRAAPGSGRRCEWRKYCGRPATHIRIGFGFGLAYCADHARLMMPFASFQPINQLPRTPKLRHE